MATYHNLEEDKYFEISPYIHPSLSNLQQDSSLENGLGVYAFRTLIGEQVNLLVCFSRDFPTLGWNGNDGLKLLFRPELNRLEFWTILPESSYLIKPVNIKKDFLSNPYGEVYNISWAVSGQEHVLNYLNRRFRYSGPIDFLENLLKEKFKNPTSSF